MKQFGVTLSKETMFYSPLRYPGGKGRLSSFIEKIFEKNQLLDGCYVEPYAGGSAIALSLLCRGYVSQVIINDIDLSIYAFWYAAIYETENLCKLIADTHVDVENWKRCKEIQKKQSQHTLLELGFSTFFLNRTNRSGIMNGGIIGGLKQSGYYKIDARFNKKDLINRIKKISRHRQKIVLYNMDALQLLNSVNRSLPNKTLIYLDPPYYLKGRALYKNYYSYEDHVAVFNVITKINRHKWIVSYDNVDTIRDLYKKYRYISYSLTYSAAKHFRGSEVMFFCDELIVEE